MVECIHAELRPQCRKDWGFDSLYRYQIMEASYASNGVERWGQQPPCFRLNYVSETLLVKPAL